MYIYEYISPIGILYLIADLENLRKIVLPNGLSKIKIEYQKLENKAIKKTIEWLDKYFNQEIPKELPPLFLEGTTFQKKIWNIVKEIPYGQIITYKQVGEKLHLKYYQAIGQAIKKNPIPILIPCHRVIGSNHTLIGYGGGLEVKEKLLNLENVKLS